jgi:hypothetical protein
MSSVRQTGQLRATRLAPQLLQKLPVPVTGAPQAGQEVFGIEAVIRPEA